MEPGTAFGPYQILRHLGTGGMGSVWLAHDTRLHRQVALKTLRGADKEDTQGRDRLMREARAAAALNHPHIAAVHDVIQADGQVVIVFEYVEGETLWSRLQHGPLPVDEAVDLGCQLADALVAAHTHGVVHRDLKPANMIIGAGCQLKVLDFGVARLVPTGATVLPPTSQTTTGPGFVGTAAYAAPEQMSASAVDERADLYSLGVVLFEMISGHRPFAGHDAAALASTKRYTDAPPLSSGDHRVPRDLEQLVSSLLARDPAARPASADAVLRRLEAIRDGVPSATVTGMRPSRRNVVALVATVVMSAVVLSLMLWLQSRQGGLPADATTPPVVAVMPLVNMSGDGSRDYIAAGIAESLITSLASLPSVTVLSRAAVADARTRSTDSAALMKDLGATYLVEGSVQQSGERLRIALNLVRADLSIAWADSYEGLFNQIFELQTRMAGAASEALRVQVSGPDRMRLANQPTSDPQALSAYWQGRTLRERSDVAGNLEAAIRSFEEATRLDARFALAHAALGEAYWAQYKETRDDQWVEKAVSAGTTALRLDPEQPEVRFSLALTLSGSGRASEAIEELQRALALRPTYEEARRQLGEVLAEQGRIDEAVAEYRKAIALRPTAWTTYSDLGVSLYHAARYAEAITALQRATELAPDSDMGFQQLGTVYQTTGQTALALASYEKAIAIRPSGQLYSNRGALLHEQGRYLEAVKAYEQSIALRPNAHITHRNLGDSYLRLRRTREARAAYRRAVALIESELKVNPRDARNLAYCAVYLQKAEDGAGAESRLRQALALAPDDVQVVYRAAVVHALAGRAAASLDALERAIVLGYAVSRIRKEEDFEHVRSAPRFEAMLSQAANKGDVK